MFKSHDYSVPFTEAEVEQIGVIFRSLPTYNKEGDYLLTEDIPSGLAQVGYPRSSEQLEDYKKYYEQVFDGRIPLSDALKCMSLLHDTTLFGQDRAKSYDKNGDGFISQDEFDDLMKHLVAHEPKVRLVTFEEFVKLADKDYDGKVSIEECGKWIEHVTKNI